MKITTIRLLHAARDWNTKTTNRDTLWTRLEDKLELLHMNFISLQICFV